MKACMQIVKFAVWSCLAGLMALTAQAARAQNYPLKPVRMVTAGAGGGNDVIARIISPELSNRLGQQVVVENRGGGSVPGEVVFRSVPDGYTVLLAAGTFSVTSLLQKTPYDPVKDFAPITMVARAPSVLVVHPSLPVKTVKELIALAKARPGQLNYSSGASGSNSHLAPELFKYMAGVNIVRIAYKSSGASETTDLLSGQVQVTFGSGGTVKEYIGAGRLRALAVSTLDPSPLFPGVPTVSASGLPGFDAPSTYGLFAPAKTPEAIIKRLNHDAVQTLHTPQIRERLFATGLDAVGGSPEEYGNFVKTNLDKWARLIKDVGIKAD